MDRRTLLKAAGSAAGLAMVGAARSVSAEEKCSEKTDSVYLSSSCLCFSLSVSCLPSV